ncbi:hypothetical protein [Pendulispora albinea]|uniref:Uncharacterized protein n=1 Tax=Pendulispora albinea TaxID=2741071 RepID=A0ABZ2LXD6_9BACT
MNTKVAAGVFLIVAGAACASNDQIVVEPVAVGMTNQLAPGYDDGDTRIYQVGVPVRLPIKPGGEQGGASPPFPRAPSIVARDVRTEIRFTISNLDAEKHSIELLIDPWNEFVRYKPGIQVVNEEEAVPDFSGFDKFFIVPGKSRVFGIITPDDCTELAIDLATAQAIIAQPPAGANVNGMVNRLFNLQNRSSVFDPLISPHIPAVIPAMTGFDLGLRSYEAANVAVEVIVDVSNVEGDHIVRSGDTASYIAMPPAELTPPKAN